MNIRLRKDGPVIGSPTQVVDNFSAAVQVRQADWEQRLTKTPADFRRIEGEIHHFFQQTAGYLTAAILARATQTPAMKQQVRQVRQEAVVPLRGPQRRPLQVRLLSGLVLFVVTLYCPPRSTGKKQKNEEAPRPAGLYPELAALGIQDGDSPALQALVARTVALSPSIEAARKELRRQGLKLDKKTVRRIAEQLGQQFLVWRQRELLAWREQTVSTPAGNELAGCRVAVQIDGGRLRVRKNKRTKVRRKKGQRKKFRTPWREPKVLVVYTFDAQGKMIRKDRRPLIDGTLLGPDHLAELVAWHLHRLGAAKAKEVVFVSDGARWIWDRLDGIIRRAGLDASGVVRVLDWCHAVQHVSKALTSLKLNARKRIKYFVQMRTWLKQSRWEQVVAKLEELAADRSPRHGVHKEIRYLRSHGEAGHLQYLTFRRRGLPCGSGAVESAIRRVINLRLKSNAMYWLEENAEGLFALRAALLTDRWDEMLDAVQQTMSHDRRMDWRWKARRNRALAPPATAAQTPQPEISQPINQIAA